MKTKVVQQTNWIKIQWWAQCLANIHAQFSEPNAGSETKLQKKNRV